MSQLRLASKILSSFPPILRSQGLNLNKFEFIDIEGPASQPSCVSLRHSEASNVSNEPNRGQGKQGNTKWFSIWHDAKGNWHPGYHNIARSAYSISRGCGLLWKAQIILTYNVNFWGARWLWHRYFGIQCLKVIQLFPSNFRSSMGN